ncbi:hypothetical protein Q8A57_10950 [Porticoccus litoralis]|uniref:Uncharacterized protein n=1 Tax=Porticoccus litoralis TaxID=434086 RepID=A0AAW8B844_9GAMM|nr:hypothetical protein [Porticoccus litoralis]MDP1521487.1 hypothetical protein [Porticoccus litoralis]
MKSIELLSTGIRLLGIYVFLSAIGSGATQYQAVVQFRSISQDDMAVFTYVGLAQVVLMVIAALFMVKFPVSLAKLILPKTKNNEVALNGSVKDIEVSLFAVIGVYILSWAIPDFFHNGLWWWYSSHSQISGMWEQGGEAEYVINQIVTVMEIAIGVYLCLRAQGLSTLLRRFREAGAK